jgi:predicted aminopeptidase
VGEVQGLYERGLAGERDEVFAAYQRRFREEVQPSFEASSFQGFLSTPLNNATLLARMRYFHRLGDFDALLSEQGGEVGSVVRLVASEAHLVSDPFDLLPER